LDENRQSGPSLLRRERKGHPIPSCHQSSFGCVWDFRVYNLPAVKSATAFGGGVSAMSRTLRFLGVSALALVGCASAVLIPEAQSVRVTKKPADVVGCKVMGNVSTSPPFN
jgi:hypothetical protein